MCNKVGASESSKDVLIKQQLAFFSEEKERKEKKLCLAASHLRHVYIKGPRVLSDSLSFCVSSAFCDVTRGTDTWPTFCFTFRDTPVAASQRWFKVQQSLSFRRKLIDFGSRLLTAG